jgi:glyoxylase-like metal-dependent hydrolase (beta-lactamase superfamily II)
MIAFGRACVLIAALALTGATRPARVPAAPVSSEPQARPIFEARYEGVLDLEGHYGRPGETRRFHSRQRFLTDNRSAARLDWTIWSEGDSAGAPETYLILGDAVFQRDRPTEAWREPVGERALLARLQAQAGLPWMIARDCRLRGLQVAPRQGPPDSIVDLRAHPQYGDVRNVIRYRNDVQSAPAGFRMTLSELHHRWALDATRTSFREDMDEESLLVAPPHFTPAPPDAEALTGTPVLKQLAEGVWSVDLEEIDSRSLVVEFADHLAVVEMALGSPNGERLADAVKRQWPAKPIRYALFSHYHPHYAGGIRAFMAEGATIVTTPGNEAFVRKVAGYPFHIAPDRFARSRRPLKLQTFRNRFELADSTNRLVAIDMGEKSDHTDEFAIFWLPKARLVFEAEQGWATFDGKLRVSRRARNLLQVLADPGADADRFVQSWPMRDDRAEMSRTEIEEGLKARGK